MTGEERPLALERPPPRPHETSGVTTRLIVRFVRERGGPAAVDAVLGAAGIDRSADELSNERGWSTYDEKIALFDAAARYFDDPNVARAIGQSVLAHRIGVGLRILLRALGTPGQILRNVARVAPKFSSVCTMEALEVGPTHATVTYRLLEGHTPSRHDCDYHIGLMSQVPVLFGMAPATVVHDQCQVRGATRCVYHVSWSRLDLRRRLRASRVSDLQQQLDAVTERAEDLQSTIADLVAPLDLDTVLGRIAQRAGVAVGARGHVLAVRPTDDGDLRVHADGLDEAEAQTLAEALYAGTLSADGTRLVVDVASARRRYGRLAALYPSGGTFFPEEQRLFAAYARNAAAALDAATAVADARAREETASALFGASRALAKAGTMQEIAYAVLDAVASLSRARRVIVGLLDGDGVFRVHAARADSPETEAALLALEIRQSDSRELADMLRAPSVRMVVPAKADPLTRSLLEAFDSHGAFVVPIARADRYLGAIVGDAGRGVTTVLTPATAAPLMILADVAAVAVENAQLLNAVRSRAAQLHAEAYRDPITALPNRRLFDDRLGVAVSHAMRAHELMAVLFLDLDRFKDVNDTLGHETGDALLAQVGARIGSCVRAEDTVARVGGDEFAVIIPECRRPEDAALVARKILVALEAPFDLGGTPVGTSASIGVALCPEHGADPRLLLNRADRAMYAAKQAGGGTFRLYQDAFGALPSGAGR